MDVISHLGPQSSFVILSTLQGFKDHTETFYLVYDELMALFFNELSQGGLPDNDLI